MKVSISILILTSLLAEFSNGKLLFLKFNTKYNGIQKLSWAFSQKVGLLKSEKQAILDMTNALRHKIATGQETKTPVGLAPNATNMMAMEWDDNLAAFAQNWADKCSKEHSGSKVQTPMYKSTMISENLSGGTVRIDLDMYGEVKGWTYVTQSCKQGEQCGHYNTLVSWSNIRLGCGYKVCQSTSNGIPTSTLNLVCEFAPYSSSNQEPQDGHRYKFMYEYWSNLRKGVTYDPSKPVTSMYAKSPPCSECPQGWDYCMLGGICATKRQCNSGVGTHCVCSIDQIKCEANGGTFDAANCKCKCPSTKYGTNCAHDCKNLPNVLQCADTCANGTIEIWLCYKSCGSCGSSVSRPYTHWEINNPAANKDNLIIRATPPKPRPAIPKDVQTSTLPNRGNCKNKEADYFCENVRARNYCNDAVFSAKWKHYCAASCNSCGNKEWENQIMKAAKNSGSVPASIGPAESTGWTETGSTKMNTAPVSNSGWSNAGSSGSGGWSNAGSTSSGWANSGSSSSGGWSDAGSSGTPSSSGDWSNAVSDSGWS